MERSEQKYNQLLSMILPSEVFEYFEVRSIEECEKAYHIYLDEKHRYPEEMIVFLTSKVFREEV